MERAVKGSNDIESSFNAPSSGFSSSLHQAPSSHGTSYSTPKKTAQRDFASFTDGDFVETKVTFDSGVKLGGIRKDNGFETSPLPTLAPPPARASSGGLAPAYAAPAPSSQTSSSASVPSLEDFLGLSIAPSAAPSATPAAAPAMAPSPFAAAPSANNGAYNPFGAQAPSQPAQPANNTSAAYMNAFYTTQPQQQTTPNPFAPAPQAYNFGVPPAAQQPQMAQQNGYYGGFSAQPVHNAQPAADPFASFGAPLAAQPVQASAPANKQPDFFF